MIIDNNIESRKSRLQWEESAYFISIKFNENSKSYEGQKFAKKIGENMKKCKKLLFMLGNFWKNENVW